MIPDLFILALLAWLIVSIIITGWFLFTLGKRSERNKKKKMLRMEMYSAPGVRNLLEDDRDDEAVETYRKFAGVDEYTARAAVDQIKQEMKGEGDG